MLRLSPGGGVASTSQLRHLQLTHVWRICQQPYVAKVLDGPGGLYTSGRWHNKGIPIVYAASSAALAALEVLVQVDPLTAPAELRLLTLDLPADCAIECSISGEPSGAKHPAQPAPSRCPQHRTYQL